MVSPALQSKPTDDPTGATIGWPHLKVARAEHSRPEAPDLTGCVPQANQVHIWAAWLDVPESVRIAYQAALSPAEVERASRFYFQQHRNRYVVAHGWLRQLLAAYLGRPAVSLDFEHCTKGKPALAGVARSSQLQFNLAHSEALALIAVARQIPVGIDLERIRKLDDAEQLVARFFSAHELSKFQALDPAQKQVAFFNLWTRKEAWLKATGEGITHLLAQVEVSLLPGEAARLLRLPQGFPDCSQWSLQELKPATGFVGAVVLAAAGAKTECRFWDHSLLGESI